MDEADSLAELEIEKAQDEQDVRDKIMDKWEYIQKWHG